MTREEIAAIVVETVTKMRRDGFFSDADQFLIQKDSGIEMPTVPPAQRYPWPHMGVGDSFFAPNRTPYQLRGALDHARKMFGHKYAARQWQEPDGRTGTRVWRLR